MTVEKKILVGVNEGSKKNTLTIKSFLFFCVFNIRCPDGGTVDAKRDRG